VLTSALVILFLKITNLIFGTHWIIMIPGQLTPEERLSDAVRNRDEILVKQCIANGADVDGHRDIVVRIPAYLST